ncbi:MAG: alpha/beta hydrolase [Microthrixaceae bacterium]|nr:alpha/beta hydrolase [Microthrixaceae bacterium]
MGDTRATEPVPRRDGTVKLADGRRLGFAEYGDEGGDPVLWFHGTPGARHQIAPDVNDLADQRGVRVITVERPGVGDSTPHLHGRVLDWAGDVDQLTAQLGIERFAVAGLSGGGPYVLACAHAFPDRVVAGAVLGVWRPRAREPTAPTVASWRWPSASASPPPGCSASLGYTLWGR